MDFIKVWKQLITTGDNLPKSVKYSPALPFAFTEHGVTKLASVLKSKKAVQMNIATVREFIAFKQFAINYKELAQQIKELRDTTDNHNIQLNQIYEALEKTA